MDGRYADAQPPRFLKGQRRAEPVQLHRFDNVDRFLASTGEFLAAREAENNLVFGICSGLQATPDFFEEAPYLAAVVDEERVVLAAVRTPARNLVLSEVDDAAGLRLLVDDLVGSGPPGLLGPKEHARAFAELWSARTGQGHRLHMAERIFRLTAVRPPRAVPGELRIAGAGDRDLLIEWLADFAREALAETDTSDAPRIVDRWLAAQGAVMYLWDDMGAVSMCGAGGATPHGIRVGPVYTPAALRRRGYASACVAAASQAQLDAGRRFCFLFTDLANPTSNHIYREIGYEPVRDVEVYRFEQA